MIAASWSPEQWVTVITAAVGGIIGIIHELRYQRNK
jgi:hypothetical protein